MNIALITAAGTGTRMHQDIPKQFINVYDKPIIIYTLEAFQKHPDIDGILVVCLEGWHDILKAYARQFGITKLIETVDGGENGQESIFNGLSYLHEHYSGKDAVLVHDGNRPLVSQDIISDSLAKCKRYGSAIAAIPCAEVILLSDDKVSSNQSFPREKSMRTQTPHTFLLEKLYQDHLEAQKRGIFNTAASCALLIELGETLFFSAGEEKNMKITTMEDLEMFKAIIRPYIHKDL